MSNNLFMAILISGVFILNACGVKGKPQAPLKKVDGIQYETTETSP